MYESASKWASKRLQLFETQPHEHNLNSWTRAQPQQLDKQMHTPETYACHTKILVKCKKHTRQFGLVSLVLFTKIFRVTLDFTYIEVTLYFCNVHNHILQQLDRQSWSPYVPILHEVPSNMKSSSSSSPISGSQLVKTSVSGLLTQSVTSCLTVAKSPYTQHS